MDFALSENQQSIRDAVQKVCAGFDDAYWLKKDREGGFPHEFHRAMADGGWLGICVPEKFGGAGLGITEATMVKFLKDQKIRNKKLSERCYQIAVDDLPADAKKPYIQ